MNHRSNHLNSAFSQIKLQTLLAETFAVTLLAISLTACSGGSSSSSGDRAEPVRNIDLKSCTYNATEGSSADFQSLSIENLKETSFGKKFNRALLEAVGKASVNETVKFVNMTDVTIYQAPAIQTSACSQELFANVATLPQDLFEEWDDARTNSNGSKGILLGLYLPEKSKLGTISSLNDQAAIIVSKNVSRWTLIHEFMHHLFMLQARTEGYDSDTSFMTLSKNIDAYNANINNKSISEVERARRATELYAQVSQSFDEQLVHFTLEEMTIEKELKDSYRDGSVAYAPPSSNWYLNDSAERAIERYNKTNRIAQSLKTEALINGLTEEAKRMDLVIAQNNLRISEINQITYQFPNKSENILAGIQGLPGIEADHSGCSHAKKGDDLDSMFKKIQPFPQH